MGRANAHSEKADGNGGNIAASHRGTRVEWHTTRATQEGHTISSTSELVWFNRGTVLSVARANLPSLNARLIQYADDPLTCGFGLTCVNSRGAFGCCTATTGICTDLYTTCANFADPCNEACRLDPAIRKWYYFIPTSGFYFPH